MDKFRGITYQRNGNKSQNQENIPKVAPNPPKSNVYANSELNIDLGGWLRNAKMLVLPSQREKLLKAIDCPSQKIVDIPPTRTYQDAPVILQNMDRGNKRIGPFSYPCS
jgi:hypothetical protein